MEKPTKFKEGDKVRVKSANLEGNIVKIYFDQLVYKLYGLTPAEIKIVESEK